MTGFPPIQTEVLILVLALLLYITDLARLIYSNEVLFCDSGGQNWAVLTPSSGFLFNRRFAVFPRPFDPGSFVVASSWPLEREALQGKALSDRIALTRSNLAYPRLACRLLLPQLFLVLPIAYLLPRNDIPVFFVLLVIYAQIIALSVWLLRVRRRLDLPLRQCLLWVFESLVCIPYAANVHRKVGTYLLKTTDFDVLDASHEMLTAQAREKLTAYLRTAISNRLQGEDTERAKALRRFEERLQGEQS